MATRVSLPVAPLAVSRTSVALDSANTARLLPRTRRRCAGQSACAGRRSAGWSDGTSARSSPDDGRAHRPWQAASGSDAGRSTAPPSGPCDHGLPRPIVISHRHRSRRKAMSWPVAGKICWLRCCRVASRSRGCCGARSSSRRARRPRTTVSCTATVGARPRSSGTSAGAMTRWSAPRTGSTAPGRARGRCTSRTASSPGRPSRPTTRRWARTRRSMSRAAARGGRPSPGTRTRPRGCAIRTCGPRCCSCGARRASGSGIRSRPGRRSATTPNARPAISASGARAASCGRAGRRSAS